MTSVTTPGPAPPSAERIQRLAFLVLVAVLASRALLLPVLAWNTRYVVDEYTQATYPLYIPMGFYNGLDPIKTVLYVYVFEAAHRLTSHAVDLLHVARMEGVLLAFPRRGGDVRNFTQARPHPVRGLVLRLGALFVHELHGALVPDTIRHRGRILRDGCHVRRSRRRGARAARSSPVSSRAVHS